MTTITLGGVYSPTRHFAEFYCDGDSHSWVGSVSRRMHKHLTEPEDQSIVHIYCDGIMKMYECGPSADNSLIWNAYELASRGFDTDEKLSEALNDERLQVEHNPWFDLYDDDGNHLDAVTHSIPEAIALAERHIFGMRERGFFL